MKTWVEMTERERDVLVVLALGWEVIEVAEASSFKRVIESDWYPATKTKPQTEKKISLGWLRNGKIHWTREGHKIQMGSIDRDGRKEELKLWDIPRFSTDRAAAMTLLDGEQWYDLHRRNESFYCKLPTFEGNKLFDDCERGVYFVSGRGATESEAICRAFLRAKGINIE